MLKILIITDKKKVFKILKKKIKKKILKFLIILKFK